MSESHNANGHASHYGRLPFRPPTVDEALPYSPFTSVVPFSPDIISFPSAEPPTPTTTLDPEQQQAAKKAVETLNEATRSAPNTSQLLQQTFQRLQTLLQPDDLTQFRFKPVRQIATSPENTATAQPNGTAPIRPSLSPFAAMLLEKTEVSFLYEERQSSKHQHQSRAPVGHPATHAPRRSIPQPQAVPSQYAGDPRTANHQLSQTPSVGVSPSPRPPGPVVKVKPLPPRARPEEYRRIDAPVPGESPSKKKPRVDAEPPAVKSREREIADRQLNDLSSLLDEMSESRDTDQAEYFLSLTTDDGELSVLRDTALARLSDAVLKLINLGCFPAVPPKRILMLQSLCEPLISATSRLSLDIESSSGEELLDRLTQAETGLRACKLVLQSMTEGCDDRRICSEDLVQGIIRLLKHVLVSCITPVVESRRTGSSSELFNIASQHRSEIHRVLRHCGSILRQIAALIGKIKLTGFTLSPIESLSIEIIFTQNGEKEADSALGIQKFEAFRQRAMDVIAQIFACHPDQRDSVVVDILNNLARLPDKRASARNFKSARESPIMLASALFMRIVQASASNSSDNTEASLPTDSSSEDEDADGDSDSEAQGPPSKPRKAAHTPHQAPRQIAAQLEASARKVAGHIATTMVSRAENVSKSGDKPFRNLLDLFVEDLCSVLGSPEWPAASVFLESLLAIMVPFTKNTKDKGVQAADMALSTMGSMGVGVIDFTTRLKAVKRSLDITQSELASKLVPLAEDALKRNINIKDVLGLDGPYRVVLESLSIYLNPQGSRVNRENPHLRSLSSYFATSWANAFYKVFGDEERKEGSYHQFVDALEKHIKKVIMDPEWFSKEYNFHDVTDSESRLAAGIIALQEPFCKYLQSLISTLLSNTQSPSAKVKARAMASLTQMIEKDPQILDDKSFPALAQLVKDSSPMVRDNTVSLISKCLEQDPSLERHCLHHILNLVTDPANLPKRKAIKLLKEIYLNTTDKGKKVRIATELLLPIVDDDKTIAELTRHTFEDIWLAPLKGSSKMDENHLKLDRENRITLLIYTAQNIQNRPAHLHAFETFFTMILAPTAKNLAENFKFCREIVADMVEDVIGTGSTAAEKAQTRILQTLSIFAKVDPKLFSADQVQLLKLYVKNLATTEDLAVFHPTVVIFRYVFPALSTLQEAFLEEVRDSLSKVTGKLALQATAGHNNDKKKFQEGYNDYKRTLLDVTHCLWIISPLVKGDPPRLKSGLEKLMGVICSVATQLEPLSTLKTPNEAPGKRILSYMILLGSFGKVCDLDAHVDLFRAILTRQVDMNIANKRASAEQMKRLKAWKSPSVAVLLLDLVLPFTKQVWDISLREQALCSIGEICQQKTKHFTRADIEKAFKLPFINKDVRLIRVVLTQFRDFLETAERRSDTGAQIAVGEGAVHGQERLETSFAASDNDHATTHIARAFLADIIQTALGNDEDLALPATEILVSISRQGLLHPKECGAALVALSTSRIPDIATAASSEHRKIHLQHETMFEKEYVSAIALAFKYQRDVFDDPRGMIDGTYRPKMQLLFEAFKQGTRKTLKKFITNILGQLDFDLAKLDATRPGIPEPVLFARFCLENCALFEYAKVDEVIHVILTIESIVLKQTGPSVALSIETDIPDQEIAPETEGPANGVVINGVAEDSNKDCVTEERLRQLTSASLILQMMWETRTFLRRAFNLQGKISTKDLQRPATRMNFITGKDIWEPFTSLVTALDTSEGMKQQCRDFAEIINVDREHAVEDEDADATEQLARAAAGYETPDEKEGGGTPAPTSGRGRKRKSSTGVGGNTPKKSRGRPSGSKKIKRSSRTPDDSD